VRRRAAATFARLPGAQSPCALPSAPTKIPAPRSAAAAPQSLDVGALRLQCRRRRQLDRTSRPRAVYAPASPRDVRSGAPSAIRPQSTARPAAFATGISQLCALSTARSVPLRLLCGHARHGEKLSRHRGVCAFAQRARPHLLQTGRGGSATLWPEAPFILNSSPVNPSALHWL
jgi:hypothetical protein